MIRSFHPCRFNFSDEDIRVVGSTISGGTSLSGYDDPVETSGGGFWRADFSGADFGGREDDERAITLAWRAANAAMIGGSVAVDVAFCDKLHQPIFGMLPAIPDEGPPVDDAPFAGSGAQASILAIVNGQAAGLRATIFDIAIASERPLIGGERFTLYHATWGPRAYEIYDVQDITGGKRITFQPPVRGGVSVGNQVDFDNVLCRMRRISEPSNALNMGSFGSASISFQEDMRKPA